MCLLLLKKSIKNDDFYAIYPKKPFKLSYRINLFIHVITLMKLISFENIFTHFEYYITPKMYVDR